MARQRKGRPVHGWVIVDKPAGIGSTDVVNKVRWAFQAQKAGHAGTLDPDATGVLAIALGEATKCVPLITDALKCYRFGVTFGAETTTDDASGVVVGTSPHRPDTISIEAALDKFRGEIQQIPPQVSAVKVDGVRAYYLAREGVVSDLAPRPLWVERLELVAHASPDHAELEMICGKGGYVRAIARDLGRALGTMGHVKWLRREWSGPFHLEDSVSLSDIESRARMDEIDELLAPLELGLADLPELIATDEGATRLRNGNPGQVTGHLPFGEIAWVSLDGVAIAIGRYMGGEVHPSRVFNR